MKIYLVSSGSYSDYSVNKAFLDEALANEYVEWLNYEYKEYFVEDRDIEYMLGEARSSIEYTAHIYADGQVEEKTHEHRWFEGDDYSDKPNQTKSAWYRNYASFGGELIQISVNGPDQVRNAKVYSELKASVLAMLDTYLTRGRNGESRLA